MGFFGEYDNANAPTGVAPVSTPKPATPAMPAIKPTTSAPMTGGFAAPPPAGKPTGALSKLPTAPPGDHRAYIPVPFGFKDQAHRDQWRQQNDAARQAANPSVPTGGSVDVGGGSGQPGLGGPSGGGFDTLSPQVKQHLGLGPGGGVGPAFNARYDQSYAAGKIPGSPGYEASVTANPNLDPQTGQAWQATDQGGWGQKRAVPTAQPLAPSRKRSPWWKRSFIGGRR